MNMLVVMMIAGVTTSIYCILQLFTFPVSNRNFLPDPAVDTRSQLSGISDPTVDTRSQLSEIPDAAVDKRHQLSEIPNPAVGTRSQLLEIPHPTVDTRGQISEIPHPTVDTRSQLSEIHHPTVDTRSQLSEISEPAFEARRQLSAIPEPDTNSGHKLSATGDQCSLGDNPTSEEADGKSLQRRLPKCLIIGFGKCGTYALKSFLTLHPDIVAPNYEIRFFTRYYTKGLDWYRRQMPVSLESQITIEKTPSYIMSSKALSRIRQFNSSIKVIIIVRDPVVRLQSLYAHAQAKSRRFNNTFESWLKQQGTISNMVDYAKYIKGVLRLFDPNQVLVVEEQELEERPLALLRNVERFLGLCHAFTDDLLVFNREKGFYCFNQSSWRYPQMEQTLSLDRRTGCFPRSKGRDHPQIERQVMKRLILQLNPYNEQLFALLGERFNWTRPSSL